MTTTSTFPFSTMEVPLMDDTMEMASPYQGHADDFDIDLDIMEDQASNPDRDMTAADDYLDSSHGPTYDQDGANDADMIDDLGDPSMIDTVNHEHYPETTNNIEMQCEDDKSYEADMLEDDYDEDIDAPVPEVQVDAPISTQNADSKGTPSPHPADKERTMEEDSGSPELETHYEAEPESLDQNVPEPQQDLEQDADHIGQRAAEESEMPNVGSDPNEKLVDDTNEADKVDSEAVHFEKNSDEFEKLKPEEGEGDINNNQPPVDGHEVSEAEQKGKEVFTSNEEKSGPESPGQSSLYPVKVYYQDNEISLFPPREGDSSETFFLEDEGLADVYFGSLLQSCREVLRDHVGENEVLVVDIEALNIQLTEDSLHTDKITLRQIVNLYLHLCHNDGIEEPEALYLTLSTKLNIFAEVSDLILAASEGKKLSEIHTWESFHEIEDVSAEFERNPEETLPEESHETAGSQGGVDPETSAHEQEVNNAPQDNQEPEKQDSSKSPSSVPDDDEHEGSDNKASELEVQSADYESPNGESCASEEQNTETTATIDQLPETEVFPEQQEEHAGDSELYEYEEGEYREVDDSEDKAHPQVEANLDATEHVDGGEEVESTGVGDEGAHQEEYYDVASEYYEQAHPDGDTVNDVFQEYEEATEETILGGESVNDAEPVLDGNSPEQKSPQSTTVTNDPLGTTENLLKSPIKNTRKASPEMDSRGEDEPAVDEEADHTSLLHTENDEAADLPFDEEEDYLDLGITDDPHTPNEEADAVSVPSKRSREPDDELDLPETPTPDAKRPRSS